MVKVDVRLKIIVMIPLVRTMSRVIQWSKLKLMVEKYTDYEEVVTDAKKSNTRSDKSKVMTKEIIYSKLNPTHPSGV